ncbi:uncharacterized protein LOC111334450 [Stylophora pistillata]|uniref:uncharacterized protein LOC111334450 n=1 Tax=Stylophora pistillata TaxID=50429 RepID=UPI000C05134D|nr:uncharacterized protein LOC111334450 [Stylophora pistillata]
MDTPKTSNSTRSLVAKAIDCPAKEFGGGVKTVGELGSPQKFLYWQFPNWRTNNKTIMVPPAYKPTEPGYTISKDGKYADEDDVNIRGRQGEKLMYDRLQKAGQTKNIGMFVIHGFNLIEITRWNKKCESEDSVPELDNIPKTGESDFIIFHHEKGVILFEVKNLKKSDKELLESSHRDAEINKAKDQLDRTRQVVEAFAVVNNSSNEQSDRLETPPVMMVIVLPSTKRGSPHLHVNETSFMYEEDLASLESFSKWWSDNIESRPSMASPPEANRAYELALSRILAVRHLGPVTESEYTANISYTLDTFKHLENLAGRRFRRIKEGENPHLFRWCKYMMSQDNLPVAKVAEREAFDTLKSVNVIASEANLLKALNKHLSDKRFLLGSRMALEDRKIFQYLWTVYIIDIDSIARFMNRVTDAKKKQVIINKGKTLTDLGLANTDDVTKLNELSQLLDKSQSGFLEGGCCTNLDIQLCENLAGGNVRILALPGKRPWAPVFTMDQLAVFEGPKKQLIIGGPGSGKTELMKAKALILAQKVPPGKKILYLIQGEKQRVFPKVMRKFFKDNKVMKYVHVLTVEFKGENREAFENQQAQLKWETYSHVFIDELWIGSKIRYEMQQDGKMDSIDELTIPKQALVSVEGYVWMSSVFDFREEFFPKISEEKIRDRLNLQRLEGKKNLLYGELNTPSLLDTLAKRGGIISRIKHPLRGVNNIVKLLQDYSTLYLERSFPYGVENMLNHNVDGQEISWIAVHSERNNVSTERTQQAEHLPVDRDDLTMLMYNKCVQFIKQVLWFNQDLRPSLLMTTSKSQLKLQLDPGDILVVNFIARYQSKHNLGDSLTSMLEKMKIPVCSLNDLQASSVEDEFLDSSGGVSFEFKVKKGFRIH